MLSGIVFNSSLLSQSAALCGTQISQKQMNWENTFIIPQETAIQSLIPLNRTLSVVVYLVTNNPNLTNPVTLTNANIQQVISGLNTYFQPISVSFKVANIINVPNYQLDALTLGSTEFDLTTTNFTPGCINIYLVSSLTNNNNNPVTGSTYMPADSSNAIYIQKSSFTSLFLAHEIGHFLGLYHTHEIIFGMELVNESNCTTAGDRCCDTDADPNIDGWVSNCLYMGSSKDQNGQYYHPSAKNIMSFSIESCQCYFTVMQLKRMSYTLNTLKKYLF